MILPTDLIPVTEAKDASLKGLADGSKESQDAQIQLVNDSGLPLETKSAKIGMVFRLIPAGKFTMGSPPDEQNAAIAGLPLWITGDSKEFTVALIKGEHQHEVTLTQAFYCGKYLVTQEQWKSVMGGSPSRFNDKGGRAPVEQVNWDDCQQFLSKLCEIEGVPKGTYRLLTEAQYEYTCRSGTQTTLYNGPLTIKGDCRGTELDAIAWYAGNDVTYDGADNGDNGTGKYGQRRSAGTYPVGQKQPTAWGLYDMLGNVGEWCSDWFGPYPTQSIVDPTGPDAGGVHVARGGSWNHCACFVRSACRLYDTPSDRNRYTGLRVVRVLWNH